LSIAVSASINRTLEAFAERIGGPSTFGSTKWYQEKTIDVGRDSFIQTHRPPGDLCGGLHVSLFNEAFGNFIYQSNSIVPNRDDCTVTSDFVGAMSLHYSLEKGRQRAALSRLQAYFNNTFVRPMEIESDGTILHSEGNNHFMLLNIEFKNECGKGGSDSSMQNVAYFAKYWAKQPLESSKYRIASFLMSIVGPTLTIYGAVYLGDPGGILLDPLTPCLHLLMMPDDRQAMIRLASTLAALKRGLYELACCYSSQIVDPLPVDQRGYPYLSHASTFSFSYVRSLSRRVFLAIVRGREVRSNDVPEEGTRVVVKFSPIGYCHKSYLALASYGYSPRVWSEFSLNPWWYITITDYIENAMPYVPSPERDSKLRHAVEILKTSGFVHGDLRSPNVLTVPDSDRIFIIDFELAGRPDDNDTYPSFLNHTDITWPHGVTDNARLEFSHDDEWVNCLTAEASPQQNRQRFAQY
jgi:hypothetical protein